MSPSSSRTDRPTPPWPRPAFSRGAGLLALASLVTLAVAGCKGEQALSARDPNTSLGGNGFGSGGTGNGGTGGAGMAGHGGSVGTGGVGGAGNKGGGGTAGQGGSGTGGQQSTGMFGDSCQGDTDCQRGHLSAQFLLQGGLPGDLPDLRQHGWCVHLR